MIEQAQGILTNSMGAAKGLALSHPIGLGVVLGVGAYFVANKYWLNADNNEIDEIEEDAAEEVEAASA